MTISEKKALLATGLFLCAMVPFGGSVFFDALNLDDFQYAARNEIILKGFSWDAISYAFTGTHALGIWFPLTVLTYLGDVVLFGSTPLAFHFGNLLWHGFAAVALFLLLAEVARMFCAKHCKDNWECGTWTTLCCAFIAALFWAVHPLRTESVVWIASRKDLVSGCFGFLGLACYLRACDTTRLSWTTRAYWCAILCFALAIMAKPAVMSFPVVAVCLEALLVGRVRWRRIILPLVMAIGCGLLAIWMQTDETQSVRSLMTTSFGARFCNAMDSIWHYVRATVWPSGLACFYPWPRMIAWGGALAGGAFCVIVGCLVIAAWILHVRHKTAQCGANAVVRVGACLGVWFLAALAPMLSIIQFGKHAYADRFTYWPSAAVAVGLMLAMIWLLGRFRRYSGWFFGVAGVLCVCYGFLAYQYTRHWRNTITVLERACAVTHENAFAHAMLGIAYASDPARLAQAVQHLEASIQILPNSENMGSLALLMAAQAPDTQLDNTVMLARQALALSAQEGTAQAALGVVALRRRDWQTAEQALTAGIAARGGDPMIWEWLGTARLNAGNYAGARQAFQNALRIDPGNIALQERIRQAEEFLTKITTEKKP